MLADGTAAYMSDGAPSDCVALPLLGYVDKVDLVVSGINPFSNIGHDVTYSGTVTAAMEAVIAQCPASPFSLAISGQTRKCPCGLWSAGTNRGYGGKEGS
jgi:5'-nucleotidase